MTPILDRIRAKGGEVVRDRWRMKLRPGRLSNKAIAWIKENRPALMLEVWPEFDQFEERAAILEFGNGYPRDEAEDRAYEIVMESRKVWGWTNV